LEDGRGPDDGKTEDDEQDECEQAVGPCYRKKGSAVLEVGLVPEVAGPEEEGDEVFSACAISQRLVLLIFENASEQ